MEKESSTITMTLWKRSIKQLNNGLRLKVENRLTNDQVKMYFKYLKDLTPIQLQKATYKVIMTEDINYFPSVAKIRMAAGANTEQPPKALTIEDIERISS